MKHAFAIFAALAFASLAAPARAQGNYRASPTGGRSALMGGTGIALARDGAAPFLNPAAIGNIDESGLAFSVNFYSFSRTTLSGFHQPNGTDPQRFPALALGDTTLNQNRVDALPSTLCFFLNIPNRFGKPRDTSGPFRAGQQRLALCGGSVERQELSVAAARYQGASGGLQANTAQSFNRKWARFMAGPTYSLYVSDRVALGISVHGMNTTYSAAWSASSVTQDASAHAINSDYDFATDAYSIDVGGLLGLVWRPDAYHTLGVSMSTPLVHITSGYDSTFHTQYSGAGQYSLLRTGHEGSFSAPAPLRAGVGFGAVYGRVRIEVDATYYVPRTQARTASVKATEVTVRNDVASNATYDVTVAEPDDAIVNGAFGIEWFASPSISVLAGASTDFSAVSPLPQSPNVAAIAQSRVHRIAGTLGLGSYGEGSELLFGGELSYGWGRAFAVDNYLLPTQLSLVTQNNVQVMLIVAGAANLSTLRSTVDRLGKTIAPNR